MYPHERSLVKHLAGKPFALIGVNSDQDVSIPQQLAKDGTVTWRSFQNDGPDVAISDTWQVRGWPTVYLIDAEGVIRYKNPRGKELDNAIEELLAEIDVEFPREAIDATREEEEAKAQAAAKAKREAAKKAAAEKKAADDKAAAEKAAKEKAADDKGGSEEDGELKAPDSDG